VRERVVAVQLCVCAPRGSGALGGEVVLCAGGDRAGERHLLGAVASRRLRSNAGGQEQPDPGQRHEQHGKSSFLHLSPFVEKQLGSERTGAPAGRPAEAVCAAFSRVGSCLLAVKPSWSNLSELDLLFKRSRRLAVARRRGPRKPSVLGRRSVRASLLALVLLAVVAESIGLESSNAKPPDARKAKASLGVGRPVPARFRT